MAKIDGSRNARVTPGQIFDAWSDMAHFPTDNIGALFIEGDKRLVVRVEAVVDIDMECASVFDLITDLERKTKLCPHTSVIRIDRQPEGPIGVGTIYYHRVVIDGQIADYQNHVVEFEAGHRMVTRSNTQPSFRIEVSVNSTNDGCRLTQQESFTISELLVPVPKSDGWWGRILRVIFGDIDVIRQGEHALSREVEETRAKLQSRLEAWLERISRHMHKQKRRQKVHTAHG